ncbi:MAG: hypothetical protein R3E72_05435 [Steroidobacteraceae bacterium]
MSVKVLLAFVSGPVLTVPAVARLPLQAPLAAQLVASVEDQLRFELPPLATLVGLADIETVGAGVAVGGGALAPDPAPDPPPPHEPSAPLRVIVSV